LKHPLQGQSFAKTLTKGRPMNRDYFVSESWSQATVITKDYKLGIMIDPSDYQRKFDFRSFGNQFFIRKSDTLEINNQINNTAFKTEIEKLRTYYQDFTSKIPDIGKQEVINNSKNKK
jgi:arylsulfatase